MAAGKASNLTCGSGVTCATASTACPASATTPPSTNLQSGFLYAKANGFVAGGNGGKQKWGERRGLPDPIDVSPQLKQSRVDRNFAKKTDQSGPFKTYLYSDPHISYTVWSVVEG